MLLILWGWRVVTGGCVLADSAAVTARIGRVAMRNARWGHESGPRPCWARAYSANGSVKKPWVQSPCLP